MNIEGAIHMCITVKINVSHAALPKTCTQYKISFWLAILNTVVHLLVHFSRILFYVYVCLQNAYLDNVGYCFKFVCTKYELMFVFFQDCIFFRYGQLMAVSLVTRGNGFNLMSQSVYQYVCGIAISKIVFNLADFPDNAKSICRAVSANYI